MQNLKNAAILGARALARASDYQELSIGYHMSGEVISVLSLEGRYYTIPDSTLPDNAQSIPARQRGNLETTDLNRRPQGVRYGGFIYIIPYLL